jgi:CO/xanthine dehydrogenase Mo-binding subunit
MAYKLLGKDFTPPDLRGKVTGKAKFAEDFRADATCTDYQHRYQRCFENGRRSRRIDG